MPAFVGEMFSTGAMPRHRQGKRRDTLANVNEAIVDGGLNWTVGYEDLVTVHEKASPVSNRKAVVRLDKPPGGEGRVLGVVHRGFRAIQNTDAAKIVDEVFGKGKPVYETGGYLGRGEVIWLLAKIDRPLNIGGHDEVVPYALMLNSHDGSRAFQIRLTTVRVVCQNTLNAALKERKFGKEFRRSHSGSVDAHMVAADEFYRATLREIDEVEQAFNLLRARPCSDDQFRKYLETLLPLPKPPSRPSTPLLEKSYARRLRDVQVARETILNLVEAGEGTEISGVRGTLWGAMNAIIEYSDFHSKRYSGRVDRVLIGDGANFKAKAYQLALELAQAI